MNGPSPVQGCIIEYRKRPIGYVQFYETKKVKYSSESKKEPLFKKKNVWAFDLFIGETRYWGKGLGTEIIKLMCDYLVSKRHTESIVVDPKEANHQAIRAYEKAGFIKLKILKNHEKHEGKYRDCWLMVFKNLGTAVEVKKSAIAGQGVFAVRGLLKNEHLFHIDDSHLVDDEKKLSDEEREWCDYFDGKVILWPSPERYINHSCEPNVYIKTVDGIRKVYTMRPVKKGEELTFDYAIGGYGDSEWECRCGRKQCRKKFKLDFFKLPETLQKKYLPYLDDWFKKKYFLEQVNALIWHKNKGKIEILLVEEHDGMWSLPGGANDPEDRTLDDAMQRELLEELKLKSRSYVLSPTDIQVSFLYDRPGSSRYGKRGLISLFLVKLKTDSKIIATADVQRMRWVSPKNARKMFSFEHHRELVDRAVKLLT